ncbi:nucleoside recognition domain-containing protein [Hwanghaeella sp.]|uniref:nucleoside recognition domain-containing protein n=1 Tax=Hwanghaeella sp. TaxID=2605943 RepID=UPI003CCBF4C4
MRLTGYVIRKTREMVTVYWELARIVVPVSIATEALSRLGVIEALSPLLSPAMDLFGLPPELGLAWLTGLLVGIWGAISLIFTLVPVTDLTAADITVFSALLLFAHALPIEQKIIQKAGPAMVLTISLRIGGGMLYAFLLHQVLAATGWLSAAADPAWIPMGSVTGWPDFFFGLVEALASMFCVLIGLVFALDILERSGVMALMMKTLSPVLRLAGIRREAEQFASVGLFLGISYGGGLLIREARSGTVPPRDIFVACIFMGFSHSIIEDTVVVMTIGADFTGVFVGRLLFTVVASAVIALMIRSVRDETFFAWMFRGARQTT